MKMPTSFAHAAPSRPPRIETDTPVILRAVMEAVCEEAGVWLGRPLPRRWVRELTAHANTVYARSPRFRRNVRAQGDKGRDYLWMFARHWLARLLQDRRPQLHARMPASFNIGQPLPPPPSAAPRPRKTVRKIPAPARSRSRPAPDYAFAAAAHFHFT